MTLGLEIGLLIAGIIALVSGKSKLSKELVATGTAARIAGLVMLLPLPLAFAAGMVIRFQNASRGNNPISRSCGRRYPSSSCASLSSAPYLESPSP